MSNSIELISSLIEQAKTLSNTNSAGLDALLRRSEMIVRNVFGEKHTYLKDLAMIYFHPLYVPHSQNEAANAWETGKQNIVNLFSTMIEELELRDRLVQKSALQISADPSSYSKRIFIVHGRDETMKQIVARSVEKLGFEPIILHEQPNKGRTIIEKFEDYSDVGFAIILLSADDMGYLKSEAPKNAKSRARQNVIFEMGYFVGKFSRGRVLLLLEQGVERPSDIDGVVYTPYDKADGVWRNELFKELKACGYDVDANKLF